MQKRYRRILSIVLAAGLLTGCGRELGTQVTDKGTGTSNTRETDSREEVQVFEPEVGMRVNTDVVTEDGETVYYHMEELTLPNPDRQIEALLEEGDTFGAYDAMLHGDCVYRYVIIFDEEKQYKETYLQKLRLADLEWRYIDMSMDFVLDGEQYIGFSEPFYSESEALYTYVTKREGEENTYYLGRLGEEGVEEILCPVPELLQEEATNVYEDRLGSDKSGNFYFYREEDSTSLAFLDGMLQKQGEVQLGGKIRGLLQADKSSPLYWYGVNEEEQAVVKSVKKGEVLLDHFSGVAVYGFLAEFSEEGSLFVADNRTIWKVTEGEPQLLYNFIQNDFIVGNLYGMEAGDEGSIRFLVELDGDYVLLTLEADDKPAVTEKQEITFAFAMEHLALNKVIARFNRQSDQYHISVMLPEVEENQADYRERIKMEMSVGKGPDLLGHDVILNIEPYVENDYLECLDGVLEDESEYLQAALKGCRIDGKLYGMPYDCSLDFVSYSKEHIGESTTLTVSQLMKAVESSDVKILQAGYDGIDIVKHYGLYDNSNTMYIDWERGESHLTEAPFLELLEFAKRYADTGKLEGEDGELVRSGEVFAEDVAMTETNVMNYLYACFEGKPALIGYPREVGNGIYVSCREIYLNASSECKEGAEEFLRYIMSEEAQLKYSEYDIYAELSAMGGYATLYGHKSEFPVHMAALEILVEKAKNIKVDKQWGYLNTITNGGVTYMAEPYTEEQVKAFYFLLENAQPNHYKAAAIGSMVDEELAPYFDGDVSAEQAAKILDNRVQLYLDERGK